MGSIYKLFRKILPNSVYIYIKDRVRENIWKKENADKINNLISFKNSDSYKYHDIKTLHDIIGNRKIVSYDSRAREERAKYLYDRISQYTIIKDRSFLDVGSGYGSVVFQFAKMGARESIGIDVELENVDYSKLTYNNKNAKIIHSDIINTSFPDDTFDIIHTNSLEHFPQPFKALHEIIRLTKKGGFIFLYLDNFWHSADASHFYNHLNIPWSHFLFDHDALFRFVKENSFEFSGETAAEFSNRVIEQFKSLNKISLYDYKHMIFSRADLEILHYLEKPVKLSQVIFYKIFKEKLKNFPKNLLLINGVDVVLKKV
jgi:ubiquinone/menaquinone biosynthesis C-methylase UbiE